MLFENFLLMQLLPVNNIASKKKHSECIFGNTLVCKIKLNNESDGIILWANVCV